MVTNIGRIGLLSAALVLAVNLAAMAAPRPASQPGDRNPVVAKPAPAERRGPATQPQPIEERGDAVAPAVIGAGPAAASDSPRGNEVAVTPAKPQPAGQVKGTLPPIPKDEELIQALKSGQAGETPPGVPSTDEVGAGLNLSSNKMPIMGVPPTNMSKAGEPIRVDVKPDRNGKLLPEGHMIRDRVGHISRERGRFVFVFEADRSGATDPPLILLPNGQLESLLAQSNNGQLSIKFRVSGEVTQYQQTNYLLLRMVLIERNLDRF